MKKVIVIGSGIAGLAAATKLAHSNYDVTIIEKNDKPGGRINVFEAQGYTFDMGPSWYWMPEVFEKFYNDFGFTTEDFYNLKRLDPSYRVFFNDDQKVDLPADYSQLKALFESFEKGSGERLDKFLKDAAYKYEVGMNQFVWKPSYSILEFINWTVIKNVFKLQLFSSISKEIKKVVKHKFLKQILEFPVLFLGAAPKDTPALYSLMNYADIKLGTWYPDGGMYKISEAFAKVAKSQGVNFVFNEEVKSFNYNNDEISEVITSQNTYACDLVVAAADYHHIDQKVLSKEYANYDNEYWESRKMAPSSMLVFLGVNKKIENLEHHNLFFDADFEKHSDQIYDDPKWPDDPLFYVCCPSKTDNSVAPNSCENLFILMPLAPDLKDGNGIEEKYLEIILDRIEKQTGVAFRNNIEYQKIFSVSDFKSFYNSFKGNAYGLANTLFQTAFLKPSIKNKKLVNLYFAGQLTTPGPGLPPSVISGQVVANEIINKR